jgi:hypothetical protein
MRNRWAAYGKLRLRQPKSHPIWTRNKESKAEAIVRLFKRIGRKKPEETPAEKPAKRMLVIGSVKHAGVKCVQWDAKDIPNVADYDAVIINTPSLAAKLKEAEGIYNQSSRHEPPDFWNRLRRNVEEISSGLMTLLESKGEVYAIAVPEVFVRLGKPHPFAPNYMTNYSWSPLPFEILEEHGETQTVNDEVFARYMSFVKSWCVCFAMPEKRVLEDFAGRYGQGFYVSLAQEPIAQNRYGKPVACHFRYQVYHQVILERDWLERVQKVGRKLSIESGPLILLPLPTEISDREAINVILEDIFGRPQKTLPPEWVEAIPMPKVVQLDSEIEKKQETIQRVAAEISEKRRQRQEIVRYKQLLFETGPQLDEICQETIEALGGIVLPSDLAEEDFIIEFEENRAIVEVKGNTKSISLADLSQLGRYREEYRIQRGEEIKGVLLGNAWRLLPLDERGDANRPIFPEQNVVPYAVSRDIALVSTVELFQAYCAFLDGVVKGSDVLRRLFDGVGVTRLGE